MGEFSIWHWLVLLIFGGIGYAVYRSANPKPTKPIYSQTVAPRDDGSSNDQAPTNDELYERVADELRQNSLRQGLWAKAFAEADGDKAKAQAAYIRYRVAELQQLAPASDISTAQQNSENTTKSTQGFSIPLTNPGQVRPWVRYWARMFDVYSFSLVGGVILAFIAPEFLEKQNEYALGMMLVFAWVFVEALLLSSFQTTPGKWLFKTNIALTSASPINFSQALARSFKVWWRGFGTGFPIAAMITMIIAHRRLTRNGITSWDKDDGFLIAHETIGVPRVLAAIAFFFVFLVVAAIGNSANA